MGNLTRPRALLCTQVLAGLTLWRLLYLIIVTIAIFVCFGNRHYDDPYITYRYAQNLSAGVGFVFNAGERVLSTTTPLFALILAVISVVVNDIPAAANLIGALCLAAGALCLHDMALTWLRPIASKLTLCIYPGFPLLLSTLGSELPLFILLCLLALLCVIRGRMLLAVLFAVLATTTRADGVLLASVLFIWLLSSSKSQANKLMIGKYISLFISLLVVWYGFVWLYFGSPLPATLNAKQAQGALAISTGFLAGTYSIARQSLTDVLWWLPVAIAGIGVYATIRKRLGVWVLLAWALLHFLGYTILGVSRYFWYYAPLVPGFVILIGVGIEHMRTKVAGFIPQWRNGFVVIICALVIGELVVSLMALATSPDQRVEIYQAAGLWLHQNTAKDESVGALEVGALGYYSERTMIDFAGLIQPDVATVMWLARNYDDTALYAISRYQPGYIVYRDGQAGTKVQEVLETHCKIVQQFDGQQYQLAGDLTVYRCHYDNS